MKRNGDKAGEMVKKKKLCPMISRTRGKQDFTLVILELGAETTVQGKLLEHN